MAIRVGVDIGGTFTDFVVIEEDGSTALWKEDSTPDEPTAAIENGLAALAERRGTDLEAFLGDTSLFVHGSTIATNEIIQRSGPRVGLLCTDGFRDVLYFRDGYKPDRYNVHLPRPADLVERFHRLTVEERIGADGEVVVPLEEQGVRDAAARFKEAEVEAVGVTFLWSILNATHEERAVAILREELPGVEVLASHEVLPEMREWERTSATVLSAYILPTISVYLRRLEQLLSHGGLESAPLIMQINGGCAYVDEILTTPVNTLASGPAAAPSAAAHYFSDMGTSDAITVDMGGTSFDVCLIRDGRAAMSRTIQVEDQPIGVAGVEVSSIGAGGGSIAWIDGGGALRVGPQSAGAVPGPAAYGAGGDHPTVTDANIVLGYLDPEAFLGGRRVLRRDLSEAAIEKHIAAPLGLSVIEAAAGIIKVVDTNMVSGIRAVSIERGIDPRTFALVAGGGAGGLHATRLARALGMPRVFVSDEAATFCAFGMTVTDVRHDYVMSIHGVSDSMDPARLNQPLGDLKQRAMERLAADGFEADSVTLEVAVDARYPNQIHELTVVIPDVEVYTDDVMKQIVDAFNAYHEQQFTYSLPDLPVEFLHWRVTAIGHTETPVAPPAASSADATAEPASRTAYFENSGGMIEVPVHTADRLSTGTAIEGPAIVQAENTTIVLNEGDRLDAVSGRGMLIETQSDVGEPAPGRQAVAA